jgi:hypothetical protein
MKINKVAGLLLAMSALASGSLMAKTISVTMTPVALTKTDYTAAMLFQGFDASLGTLTGVTFNMTSGLTSTLVVTDLSGGLKNGVGKVQASMTLSIPVDTVHSVFTKSDVYAQAVTFAAGTAAGTKSPTYTNGNTLAGSASFSTPADLSWFTTSSQLSTTVGMSATSSMTGSSGLFASFRTYATALGNVTYTYTAAVAPVPEPETYGMLLAGLGLMGVVARRKARSAKA